MKIKELDIIITKDGKEGTVLETFDKGAAFLVEICDSSGKTIDTPILKIEDIESIKYKS